MLKAHSLKTPASVSGAWRLISLQANGELHVELSVSATIVRKQTNAPLMRNHEKSHGVGSHWPCYANHLANAIRFNREVVDQFSFHRVNQVVLMVAEGLDVRTLSASIFPAGVWEVSKVQFRK